MLGELQVVDGDVDLPIRGAKQRALLLLLLVRARETVQAERLADELWGDDLPAGGANALQALVSKLRRAPRPAERRARHRRRRLPPRRARRRDRRPLLRAAARARAERR